MMSQIDANFYKAIEAELKMLLRDLHGLQDAEVEEIARYLNAGEYGLTLGTICLALNANGIAVNREKYRRIEALPQKMEMDMGYCAGIRVE